MGSQSRKTPNAVARMIELHRRGASSREIAEELKLGSHRTVAAWLRDAGFAPNGGHGPRRSRPRVPLNGVGAALADAQAGLVQLEQVRPPTSLADVLDRYQRDFAAMEAVVGLLMKDAPKGLNTMGELEKAMRIRDAIAVKLKELYPKDQPDPEVDPANQEAAQAFERKLMGTVEAARRNARCVNCGKNPFTR